jgi:hypothetical protein
MFSLPSFALHRQELVVGVTKEVTMNISLTNSGEDSYMTNMALNYPRNLQFKKIQKVFVVGAGKHAAVSSPCLSV